jgi:hypothetical protein
MKRKWTLPIGLPLLASWAAQAQFTYETNSDGTTLTITSYSGSGGVVAIPADINGLPVTMIGLGAFQYCSSLISVTIPHGVTSIGTRAFGVCTNLTNATIPDSLTNIGESAFFECSSLPSVTIPASVINIGGAAFSDCSNLCAVTIPAGVVSIGQQASDTCTSLTNITIPASVTNIGAEAFFGCVSLTAITLPGNAAADFFRDNPDLTNLTIADGATNIVTGAFEDVPFISVVMPASVANIGNLAYAYCYDLTSIYFQGNAPTIAEDTFQNDKATVYYLPGTTGWGSAFGGLPLLPWLLPYPVILQSATNFGVQPSGVSFTVSWASNATVVVQACTNLSQPDWQPLQTNTILATNGVWLFSDPQWTNFNARYCRLSSP